MKEEIKIYFTKIIFLLVICGGFIVALYFQVIDIIEKHYINGYEGIKWWGCVVLLVLLIVYILYYNMKKHQCIGKLHMDSSKYEFIENISSAHIRDSVITWKVEKTFPHDVETYYEKFKNSDGFDRNKNELIDLDEFFIVGYKLFEVYLEKHGLKPKVNITDKVLPTVMGNRELMFRILSVIAVECVLISASGSEVLCDINHGNSKIRMTINCKVICLSKTDFKFLHEDKFQKMLKLLHCSVLAEVIEGQAYFTLEI